MQLKENFLSKFINISLKILLALVIATTIYLLHKYSKDMSYKGFLIFLIFALCGLGLNLLIKKGVSTKKLLILIILFGFILRFAWIISINSIPVSDFGGLYMRSEFFLQGNYYMFKGHNYYARFPHLTIMLMYFALIRSIFSNPLFTLKVINVLCSTSVILLCYLVSKEIFNSKTKALWTSFIAAIYPPIVIYTAVYCSENIAIPFYLLSLYLFILVLKKKKPIWFLCLSALSLSVGNFFRMVATVMVIAYIMYLLFYDKEKLKNKIKSIALILAGFYIPLVLVSNILIFKGITEYELWSGSEPMWTSILKGTNLQTYGRFNYEDSNIGDKYNSDYKKTADAAKQIVKDRLTKTPVGKLAEFFYVKYTMQWAEGDFGAIYWAESKMTPKDMVIDLSSSAHFYVQLFYLVILIFTYIGLFNKRHYMKNPLINLLYIIYCGYGLLYLITESQDRYSFIVSWIFIILAFTAFDKNVFLNLKSSSNKLSI